MIFLFISFFLIVRSELSVSVELSQKQQLSSAEIPLQKLINVNITQTAYIGNLSIGSPAQEFTFIFDTSSSVSSN